MSGYPPESGTAADALGVRIDPASLPADSDPGRTFTLLAEARLDRARLRRQVEDLTVERDRIADDVARLTYERDEARINSKRILRERDEARAAALANAQERDALLEALDGRTGELHREMDLRADEVHDRTEAEIEAQDLRGLLASIIGRFTRIDQESTATAWVLVQELDRWHREAGL